MLTQVQGTAEVESSRGPGEAVECQPPQLYRHRAESQRFEALLLHVPRQASRVYDQEQQGTWLRDSIEITFRVSNQCKGLFYLKSYLRKNSFLLNY